ncbi:3-carboxyethylcatechol 2,3-dioxygenase [Halomonas binhaiensis]|uniref:2,3-dihydroxyphenylpropionate/2,3-dihydroxicinnamic acid 1,2-dioxygenase n=1 Tax=Halomonas binhaiensis TaxID=2562282 RepID=A0A5C1NCQ6_9GAMM|nr:3-carboxyethylcatechol 2,3-dioxygenase [Halomonas binhaiensis]QEM80248.1 3-carboxyethylcatechol 2,3-dioxygenase [Halomonas binhaiensis]
MTALLQCLSHTPLIGHLDPSREVLDEVNDVIDSAARKIAEFDPELVILFAPDHYNGFFYDIMPAFCVGTHAHAIGDFGSAKGDIYVPEGLAEGLAIQALADGVDIAVSHKMQVDHGFAQPLQFLLGGLDKTPTIPVFINSVAVPLPGFKRARILGESVGRYAKSLGKRTLFIGSGGLSHQPPVPELSTASSNLRDRLLGSGRDLPLDEREARTQRVIDAARRFVDDQNSLHPLNPEWDQKFLELVASGCIADLDGMSNEALSEMAGKSTHEVKTWVAAGAALSAFGPSHEMDRYYRPIPEWIAGFGALTVRAA